MTARSRAELEGRLAQHLKEEIEHLIATTDIGKQRHRLERRLLPIRRRRRPLQWSAVAAAATAVAVTVALLVSTTGNGKNATAPATKGPHTWGTFTSEISQLAGLRFIWPTPGWRAVDSPYGLVIHPPGVPGAVLRLAKGCYPTDPSGAFVTTSTSATAVAAALADLPALKTSRPVREHIGEGLAAVHVDIRLSRSAPRSGFDYLTYNGGNNGQQATFAIRPGIVVRIYAAVYRAPYGNELLNIAVEAPANEFSQAAALASRALQSFTLPNGFVAGRTFYP